MKCSSSLSFLLTAAVGFVCVARCLAAPKSPIEQFTIAVGTDDVKKVEQMLDEDPSLATSVSSTDGTTPLHHVLSVKVAGLLLDQGANLFALDTQYQATPLRYVAWRFRNPATTRPELVKFLQSKGANEPDIFFASAVGDVDRVKLLLSQNPKLAVTAGSPDDLLADGATPIHVAAYMGQLEVIKVLVDNGASVNDRGSWHNTEALEKAAYAGRPDVVNYLLDHGAKIDGPDPVFADSPLHNAAMFGRVDCVKILVDRGAKVPPSMVTELTAALRNRAGESELKTEQQKIVELLKPKP